MAGSLDRWPFSPSTLTWLVLLLDATVKAAIVLAVAGLIVVPLRRASAAVRHLVWCVGIGGAVALPLLLATVPAWQWHVLPSALSAPRTADWSASAHTDNGETATRPRQYPATPVISPGSGARGRHSLAPSPLASRLGRSSAARGGETPVHWSAWTLLAWTAGAVLVATPLLIGTLGLRRIARRATPIGEGPWAECFESLAAEPNLLIGLPRWKRVTLRRSDRVSVPVILGIFCPTILLPAEADDWPAERHRMVLLHELAHVQRADCATQLLAQVACVIFWLNPLTWIAARQVRIERERACDDRVLQGGVKASDYARHLLEIARRARRADREPLAAVAMARPSQLENRLLAVLDADRPRRAIGRRDALAALATVSSVVLPLAAIAPVPRSSPREGAFGPAPSTPGPLLWRLPKPPGNLRYYYSEQVSPDGTKLAVVHYSPNPPIEAPNIAVYEFATRRLTFVTHFKNQEHPATPDFPVWSPDGTAVVFTQRDYTRRSELWIATIGQPARRLYRPHEEGEIRATHWLRDGSAVVAVLRHRDRQHTLGLVSVPGGAFRPLRSLLWNSGGRPQVSPDGRYLVFEAGREGSRALHVVSRDGRSLHVLAEHPADDAQPLWSPNSRHVVFLSRRAGRWGLWGVEVADGRTAGKPFLIKDGMDSVTLLSWTRSDQLYYQDWFRVTDVFTVAVDPATGAATDRPRQLPYPHTGQNLGPAWSPDGERLAFFSFSEVPGDEKAALVVLPTGGGPARTFPIPLDPSFDPSRHSHLLWHLTWLRDGSGLSLPLVEPDRPPVLLRLDLASGEWIRIPLPSGVSGSHPSVEWSNDGRAYYTNASPAKGMPEQIVEYRLATGESRVIWTPDPSIAHVRHLSLSPDGKAVAFAAVRHERDKIGKGLMLLSLETKQTRLLTPFYTGTRGWSYLRAGAASWSPDGRHLLVEVNGRSHPELHVVSLDGGRVKKLDLGDTVPRGAPSWSPDGRRVAFATFTFLFDNWVMEKVIPPAQARDGGMSP